MKDDVKKLLREVALAFWKVHILHHAGEGPVVGQWMLQELREHGYEVSPGTLYPLLRRMESYGWIKGHADPNAGPRAKREYRLTPAGRRVLNALRTQIDELSREILQK